MQIGSSPPMPKMGLPYGMQALVKRGTKRGEKN